MYTECLLFVRNSFGTRDPGAHRLNTKLEYKSYKRM